MTEKVTLSQVAPWNPRLRNPYRTRWTEVGGRYFKVAADRLDGLWFVDEVDADGEPLVLRKPTSEEIAAGRGADPTLWEFGFSAFAMNLTKVREQIVAEVTRDKEQS